MRNSHSIVKMKKWTFYLLLVIQFFQLRSATDCMSLEDIQCVCDNHTMTCSGLQNESTDILAIVMNISSSHYSHGNLVSVDINVENLLLYQNMTFEMLRIENLKLNSGLVNLDSDIFSGVNTTLINLNLQNNSFADVPINAIHVLGELENLDLSNNRITALAKRDFQGLIKLKILNLKYNNIGFMFDETFMFLPNLEKLFLDFNKLSTVGIITFNNLNKLKLLSISSNDLQDFEPETIKDLPSIHKLVIDNNSFSSVLNMNIHSPTLIELSAQNCSLEGSVEEEHFNNLPKLKFLDLSFNTFNAVNSSALSKLQDLNFLNLSNNIINVLHNDAFGRLKNLTKLNLEHNKISIVGRSAFYGLTKLKYLNLSDNKLTVFLCDYTLELFALETIELENNQLKIVRSGTFVYSVDLKELKMNGNRMDCTCFISDFAGYLQNNTFLLQTNIDSVKCDSPPLLHGKRVIDVDFNAMKCVGGSPCESPILEEEEDDDDELSTDIIGNTTVLSTDIIGNTTVFSTDIIGNTTELSTDIIGNTTVLSTDIIGNTTVISTDIIGNTTELSTDIIGNTTVLSTDIIGNTTELSTNETQTLNTDDSSIDVTGNTLENSTDISGYTHELRTDITKSTNGSSTDVTRNTLETSTDISENTHVLNTDITKTTDGSSINVTENTLETSTDVTGNIHGLSTDITANISITLFSGTASTTMSKNYTAYLSSTTDETISPDVFISTATSNFTSSYLPVENSTEVFTKSISNTFIATTSHAVIEPEIYVKNYSFSSGNFCIEWSLGGNFPNTSFRCLLSYVYENRASTFIQCPSINKSLHQQCLTIRAKNELNEVCIKISESGKRIATHCFSPPKKTTTQGQSTITSVYPTLLNKTATQRTTTIVTDFPILQNNTITQESTTISIDFPIPENKTTTPILTSFKAFNITYFNILLKEPNSALVEWRVNRNEPSLVCLLILSVATEFPNHTEERFNCSHNTFLVTHLEHDVTYEFCLTIDHISYGVVSICRDTYYPSYELGASKSAEHSQTLPVAVLIGLLVVVICIVVLLVVSAILRKKTAADRYNVSNEEMKVQKRNEHKQSSSSKGHSIRYSYTISENTDAI